MKQNHEISSTKNEAVRVCPESLGRIIEGVNNLPVDIEEIQKRLVELAKEVINSDYESVLANIESYRAEIVKLKLKKQVLDYLIGEMPGAIILGLVAQNFNELILAEPVLQGIAEINQEEKEQYGKNAFSRTPHNLIYSALAFNQGLGGIRFSATLKLSGGSFIRPNLSGLPLVFESENIPPERIRKCPVCQKIFWAKRIESPACSKHVSAFNSRKTRNKTILKELEASLEKQLNTLKKYQSLSPEHNVITKTKEKISKLTKKIERRKSEYGTLQTSKF